MYRIPVLSEFSSFAIRCLYYGGSWNWSRSGYYYSGNSLSQTLGMERRAERDSKEDDGQMANQHNDDEERKSQQWPTTQWRVRFASSAD